MPVPTGGPLQSCILGPVWVVLLPEILQTFRRPEKHVRCDQSVIKLQFYILEPWPSRLNGTGCPPLDWVMDIRKTLFKGLWGAKVVINLGLGDSKPRIWWILSPESCPTLFSLETWRKWSLEPTHTFRIYWRHVEHSGDQLYPNLGFGMSPPSGCTKYDFIDIRALRANWNKISPGCMSNPIHGLE